jgi:hypothetical protein
MRHRTSVIPGGSFFLEDVAEEGEEEEPVTKEPACADGNNVSFGCNTPAGKIACVDQPTDKKEFNVTVTCETVAGKAFCAWFRSQTMSCLETSHDLETWQCDLKIFLRQSQDKHKPS